MAIGQIDLSRTLIMERYFSAHVFNAIPRDQGEFRPQEDMRTIAGQLSHIGAFDDFLFLGIRDGSWAADVFTDRPEKTVEEALAYLDFTRTRLLKLIEDLTEERLVEPIGPNPIFSPQMGLSNVILTTLSHECHHRGQLVTYLRLLGVTPPPLGGAS